MGDTAPTRQVTVVNPQGLHLRSAHTIAQLAQQYKSDIRVVRDETQADGKSVLSLVTLVAEQGTELTLEAAGDDASDALDALEKLFADGFGEMDDPVNPQ